MSPSGVSTTVGTRAMFCTLQVQPPASHPVSQADLTGTLCSMSLDILQQRPSYDKLGTSFLWWTSLDLSERACPSSAEDYCSLWRWQSAISQEKGNQSRGVIPCFQQLNLGHTSRFECHKFMFSKPNPVRNLGLDQ
jgi:hypothetical protein